MHIIKLFVLFVAFVFIISCSGAAGNTASSVSGSGSDIYYEYTSHSTGPGMTLDGFTKMYLSADGLSRKEMVMTNPAKPDKGSPIVSIGNAGKPYESISIDDDAKTWTTNRMDSADADNAAIKMESVVSNMGNEKVSGFDCVHARIISNKNIGNLIKEVDTMDIWKSGSVPVPGIFKNMMERIESGSNFIYAKNVPPQLRQMGCDGFLVKMQIKSKDVSSLTTLTKVERRDLSKSLFQTPAGYKEDKEGL